MEMELDSFYDFLNSVIYSLSLNQEHLIHVGAIPYIMTTYPYPIRICI